MPIGVRIRQARLAAGISQARLAELMRVTRSACSQWESQDAGTAPRLQRLADIARYLGVNYAWLVTGQQDSRGPGSHADNAGRGDDDTLSWQKQRLLLLYDHLPERARASLLHLLDDLIQPKNNDDASR